MLLVDRAKQTWTDSLFTNLSAHVNPNDVLVINNTRVFPARLIGQKSSGGRVEVLLVRELENRLWEALVRPGRRLKKGAVVYFGDGRLRAEMLDEGGSEIRQLRFESHDDFESSLNDFGDVPLPPYISRPSGASEVDRERYQTLFAKERGAIAAPTAGLHFTPAVMEQISSIGAKFAEITLHVGYGTFEPVRATDTTQHQVAAERYEIDEAAAQTINEARSAGGRVIAIGTTTTRALESAASDQGVLSPTRGNACLTIVPGYNFRIVEALLTNFHLPRSSLLMLVSAFSGHQLILNAYRHAVAANYRFYSYGDCMLVI
jgi:S-adenosylmethionine:tRNA ribosyltransferase-isomerase